MARPYVLLPLVALAACGPHFTDDAALVDISGRPTTFTGPEVAIGGRTGTTEDGSTKLSWAGTTLSARFTGSRITAKMKLSEAQPQNFYLVSMDGNIVETRAVNRSDTTQSFEAPAGDGPHALTLTKLNEPMDGSLIFGGFTPEDGGALLPTQTPSGRRIEFVGDSITCGYGNQGFITTKMLTASSSADANSLRSCKTFLNKQVYEVSSAYMSWGPQVARAFNAEYRLTCWSGKGVYRNADNTDVDLMPEVFNRAVATDANTSHDFNDWIPQAVVVDLGTNDFGSVAQASVGGAPDVAKFEARYIGLVKRIRQVYPNAWIILANGPLLSDYYPRTFKALSTMRKSLNAIIDKVGDGRVQYFEFPLNIQSDSDTTGCEWHPDTEQDTAMATRLQVALQSYLGWKQ